MNRFYPITFEANEYCTGNTPEGTTCTAVEGSMLLQYVNTTAFDESLAGEVEKSILSLVKKEIASGNFTTGGTSNLHYIERSSTENHNGNTPTNSGLNSTDGNELNIKSGFSQTVGISSIAAVGMVLAGAAFLVKRNMRKKRETATDTLSNGKVKDKDSIKPNGTDEEISDDDDQSVEDPVKSRYYNFQHRRTNFLSTISEVSEETDSSVFHTEDPERILSESTYEYNTSAV